MSVSVGSSVDVLLLITARAALLTGRLPIRNGFYTTNAHARNGQYSHVGYMCRLRVFVMGLSIVPAEIISKQIQSTFSRKMAETLSKAETEHFENI